MDAANPDDPGHAKPLSEPIRALVIDDNPTDVLIVRRLAATIPDASVVVDSAASVEEAETMMAAKNYDVLLLDQRLPREDGLAFLLRARETLEAPAVLLTGENDVRVAVSAIRTGAYDYLSKDGLSSDLLSQTLREAVQRFREQVTQQRADERALVSLAASVEASGRGEGHLRRMAFIATELGVSLGLKWPQISALRLGAVLHDIGSLAIPADVFLKREPLNDEEWTAIKRHPAIGEALCSPLRLVREVSPIVRHHHERWDGAGYPDGLSGNNIPILARIISVVDGFDAMISERPYGRKMPVDEAMRELSQGAGSQWDPEIADCFLTLLTQPNRDILGEAEQLSASSEPDALWEQVHRPRVQDWLAGQ
jgi:putative two-component system response regulator